MSTLLVLGSKPEPSLPPRSSYDAVACANASGFSAAQHQLPTPTYTVMSAILTSGIESGKQSLRALTGLKTDTVYFYPRPDRPRRLIKRLARDIGIWRMKPFYMRRTLDVLPYEYKRFVVRDSNYYPNLVKEVCAYDDEVTQRVGEKPPSSGVIALIIGIAEFDFERYVLSGFSFELTHAYGENPEIGERGTRTSRHANTDTAVIRCLSREHGNIYTTEPAVNERTGIPMLTAPG